MKRVVFLHILLILLPIALAQNMYLYDSLDLELTVEGGFELVATKGNARVREASASLLLFPENSFRQEIINLQTAGTAEQTRVDFLWDDQQLGEKTFKYTGNIKTNNQRKKVTGKISFPLTENQVEEFGEYLLPTETIDSLHPSIIAQANELVEGEDDLFKAVFKLASWVEANVKYDLTTLTADTSQKASWVLQQKEGVCDEMTSLFVAMARAVGIPARFVSGISYTTSDLFDENWQPHGWAEVYFPTVGWVGFDITFGEYGYVDVTHIKLRDGFDPAEPATKYRWLAENVELQSKDLTLDVSIAKRGTLVPENIDIAVELLSNEVDLGSHNLVKGIVKNKGDYYTATTLDLAIPEKVSILGRDRRTLLLGPGETKETFWIIKLSDNLDTNFWYTFPVLVYSEKNITSEAEISAQNGKQSYSRADIEKLTVQDEEKGYSRFITFSCDYNGEVAQKENSPMACIVSNEGTEDIQGIEFCVGGVCKQIDLAAGKKESSEIIMNTEKVGWNKVILSVVNSQVDKKSSISYIVTDLPQITVKPEFPSTIDFGRDFPISISLSKGSFSIPVDVAVILEGPGFENKWNIEEFSRDEKLSLLLEDFPLQKKNTFTLTTMWKDKKGQLFSEKQEIVFSGKANSVVENLRMFLNKIVSFFG